MRRNRRARTGQPQARPAHARTSQPAAAGAPAGTPRFLQSTANSSSGSKLASAWASRLDRPPCCDHLDDAKTWAGQSYGPQDIIGGGGLGGFTAWYFPFGGPGILHLVQSIAAQFKDTLVVSGGTITPHADLPVTPGITALAARLQALPEPDRTIALSSYQWTATEQTRYLGDLETLVQDAWSWQYSFFLNQPCWEWISADVNVDVRFRAGAKAATDHMDLEAYKLPTGESLRNHGIPQQVSHGSGTDAYDQSMRLDTSAIHPRQPSLLRDAVEFEFDSDELTPAAQTKLTRFIARFNGATAHPAFSRSRIDLVGRASSSGTDDYNLRLSERRAEAVRQFLADNGLVDVPIRVHLDPQGEAAADQTHDEPKDRRVDLLVDGGQHMFTATHEFGHAFGLDDEYATTAQPTGSNARHHDMARAMTDSSGRNLPGAAVEHTGGIMSFGNEVRPQHYATFHHALETVTAKSPWALGDGTSLADIETVCSGAGLPPCTGDTCVATTSPESTSPEAEPSVVV